MAKAFLLLLEHISYVNVTVFYWTIFFTASNDGSTCLPAWKGGNTTNWSLMCKGLLMPLKKIIFIRFWHEDCDFRLPVFVFTSFDWHTDSTICKHLSICIQNLCLLTEILLLSICVPNSKINAHKILTGTLTEDYGGLLFCFFMFFFPSIFESNSRTACIFRSKHTDFWHVLNTNM